MIRGSREMRHIAAILTMTLCAAATCGADRPLVWPQFRGPNGSGVAEEQKPPIEVGPEKNVRWKVPVPSGLSSPTTAGGLAILVRDEIKDPRILAIDAATGSFKWEKKRTSRCSYATPIVWDTPEGKQIVAAGHGHIVAYDLKSGDERWSVAGMPSG